MIRNRFTRPECRGTPCDAVIMVIRPGGEIVALHSDEYDFRSLGTSRIRRASHVEPDEQGAWTADLAPVGGPKLGPFPKRSGALRAEREWLERHLATLHNERGE